MDYSKIEILYSDNQYIVKALSLVDILNQPFDQLNSEVQIFIQKMSHSLKKIHECVEFIKKEKKVFRHLTLLISLIIYESSKKLNDKTTTLGCSLLLARSALMVNSNLDEYAIVPLEKSFSFVKDAYSEKVDTLIEICELLAKAYRNTSKFELALKYYNIAINVSEDNNLYYLQSLHEYLLGKMYLNYLKQSIRGLQYIEKAIDTLNKIANPPAKYLKLKAVCFDEKGNIHRRELYQFQKAIELHNTASKINYSINNIAGVGRNISHKGLAYWKLGQKDKAVDFLAKGLEKTKEAQTELRGVGVRLGQLGYMTASMGKHQKGMKMLNDAISINIELNDHKSHIRNLINLSYCNELVNDFTSAEIILKKAFELSQKYKFKNLEITVSYNLGSLLCDKLESFKAGYTHYHHAFLLHQKAWSADIDYVPEIEMLSKPEELRLMYVSLIKRYHNESTKMIELLNYALKRALTQSIKKEEEVLISAVHRLRGPLTAIRNYFDFVIDNQDTLQINQIVPIISKSNISLHSIEETVNDFLNEATSYGHECVIFNPDLIIKRVVNKSKHQFVNVGIYYNKCVDLEQCFGDLYSLEMVLKEVVQNACEATKENENVKVSYYLKKTAIIDDLENNFYLIVTIEDQGPGIPKENLRNIFKPHFTTKDHGKGLGLSLATKVIQSTGGSIKVTKNCANGTEFSIFLPVKIEDKNEQNTFC